MIKMSELYALLDDCHIALAKASNVEDAEYTKMSKRLIEMKGILYRLNKDQKVCSSCNLDNSESWLNNIQICNVCGAVE